MTLSSRERLDLNISTTFTELAITTMNMLGKERDQVLSKARGSYAPYRIQNCTGSPIFIWSDTARSGGTNDPAAVKVAHDQTVDWRFDDWKTMREVFPESIQLDFTNLSPYSTFLHQVNTPLRFSLSASHGNSFGVFLSTGKGNLPFPCVLARRNTLTVSYVR